ncbi:MAG: ABC-2 family transporter protein [Clostridia bacterium]|nr:ABC-2 family transporter protein [Clostridia bacterium]
MKAIFTFFRMRLINGLQYRTAAWAGIVTQFFWGFMEILLYKAFYEASPERFPMAFADLVSYIWLRQGLLALLNTWTFEHELFAMILNGNVAYELCRPTSLYGMWFARTLALRISRVLLRCIPLFVVASLLPKPWGLNAPASLPVFGCFLLSLALATCVGVAFCLILYYSCFYTLSSEGIRMMFLPIAEFLSGDLIPLPFLPDWLARIFHLSPFGSMANAPLRIYSGDLAGAEMAEMLALQVFWLAVLCLLGYCLQRRGIRRLCVQGG